MANADPAPLPASGWRVWWRLTRPFSLTASAVPVLVGTSVAIAVGQLHRVDLFLAMLVASLLIQVATNLFNEYYDYRRGLDTPDTVGIAGAIVHREVPPLTVFAAAIGCFAVAFVLGLHIVANSRMEVLLVGLASGLVGYLYTGGPLPIAYTPLGELMVFVFMGPVIVGLAYVVQASELSAPAMWASLPIGCLVAAILLANNLRDADADRRAGRRTIPIVLGRSAGIGIYLALVAGAYLVPIAGVFADALPWTAAVIPAFTTRAALEPIRLLRATTDPRALNAAVRGSAAVHARFGLVFALGIALGPAVGWQPPAL